MREENERSRAHESRMAEMHMRMLQMFIMGSSVQEPYQSLAQQERPQSPAQQPQFPTHRPQFPTHRPQFPAQQLQQSYESSPNSQGGAQHIRRETSTLQSPRSQHPTEKSGVQNSSWMGIINSEHTPFLKK